ncbi:MAG: efflux RND transporter permease subunit [Pseudomonadota bacterium]
MQAIFQNLIQLRWFYLGLVVLVTGLALSQLPKLEIDNSNEAFFMTGDPTKERLDEFKETFGNDDFVFILVDVDDAFTKETLSRLADFADRLEYETPHLLDLTWIGNVESIEGVPGGIIIDDLIPSLDLSPQELNRLKEKAINDSLYRDRIVSSSAQSVGILMEFENYPDIGIDPRKDVPPVILDLVEEFSDLDTHVVGGPVMDYVMDEKTAVEAPTWMVGALLGMIIILSLTTRSVIGVLVPAATVVLSVIWVMGFVALVGYRLNLLVILVPTLMLCVGIGDTMHVVAEFKQNMQEGQKRREALLHTLDLVSGPILLTTLTTSIGFLAFTVTDLIPLIELGIQAAIGVFVAFFLTYLFAVPVLSFGKVEMLSKSSTPAEPKTDIFDRLLMGCADSVSNNKLAYGIGFALATAVALVGVTKLEIETNTVQDLPKEDELRAAFDYVDENMGGSMSLEFVINTGAENGIKDQTLLTKVEALQSFLDQHPLVTQTSSVLDQLKQMNRAVHENDEAFYVLPENSNQVAEYLLLYESGGGAQLEKYVGFTYDQMRVQARTRSIALADTRTLTSDVQKFVDDKFGDEVDVYATGTLAMFERLADLVKVGQGRSFLFAFVAVSIIMILTLRSVQLGLIAMIPNVLPVAFALGAMGWAGAQLNMIGLILAPMIIGVAVDDTVHFFFRYRRYFAEMQDYDRAYKETMRTVGRPLLFTTMVLVVGFGGFAISDFAGPRNFSWASSTAFTTALLAEFLLVPVLLAWLKPMGAGQRETSMKAVSA